VKRPNIIFIYADDLGRGMLSCYGQKWFTTPHIDRLAAEGVRFDRAYGCALCAPARASLITGYHDCHKGNWSFNNAGIYITLSEQPESYDHIRELVNNSFYQSRENDIFLPQIAREAGYVTGEIGKLEWGFATSKERIERHGWDYHYGYYDHQRCHGFYPPFLFENGMRVDIEGNTHRDCGKLPEGESVENKKIREDMTGREVYSQDLFNDKIKEFIQTNKDRPFFLFHPSQLPHGPIAVPEIHEGIKDVEGLTDYEKEYASMVLRLDDTVGMIIDELEKTNLLDKTIIIFTSDNGHEIYHTQEGRTENRKTLTGREIDNINTKYYSKDCGDIFNGNDSLAGLKRSNLEGGVKIPCIVRIPDTKAAGSVSSRLIANYDFMATLANLVEAELPADKDGLTYLESARGLEQKEEHEFVVYASYEGPALVTQDNWKLRYVRAIDDFELYNLNNDYDERENVANEQKELVDKLAGELLRQCDGNLNNGYVPTHQYLIGKKGM
jgi:arylsulfatase A-like enzyme